MVVGGVWRLVTWTRVLPAGLRDPFYGLVARSRYALFGEYRGETARDRSGAGGFYRTDRTDRTDETNEKAGPRSG